MEKIKEGKWKETARKYAISGRCILERDAPETSLKEYEANRHTPAVPLRRRGGDRLWLRYRRPQTVHQQVTYGTVELAYINSRNFVTSRIDGKAWHHPCGRFWRVTVLGNLTTYYPPVQWKRKRERIRRVPPRFSGTCGRYHNLPAGTSPCISG